MGKKILSTPVPELVWASVHPPISFEPKSQSLSGREEFFFLT